MSDVQTSELEVVKLLGEGGFGNVYLLQDADNPDVRYAMKVMNILQMGTEEVDLMVQEIRLLGALDHKHVLKYVGCFRQNFNMCIVTDFCPNGDLGDYIEYRRGTKLEEAMLIEWFRQIASAVEYLHSNNVIHRDLKLKNVFLNEDMDCILGDLGVARMIDSGTEYAKTVVGTTPYMSPELFMGLPYNSKTDIWSLGVMMYELAALEKPFNSFFVPQLIHQVTIGETPAMPDGYCKDFGDLLASILEKIPNDRPSASQIVQHKLFQRNLQPKPLERFKTGIIEKEKINDKHIVSYLKAFIKMKQVFQKYKRPREVKSGAETSDMPQVQTKTMTLKEMRELDKTNIATSGKTTYMKGQFEQFKQYCMEVVENDEILFKEASLALNKSINNVNVEKRLKEVLGKEKFEKCEVQMLCYKNYGHNLRNK